MWLARGVVVTILVGSKAKRVNMKKDDRVRYVDDWSTIGVLLTDPLDGEVDVKWDYGGTSSAPIIDLVLVDPGAEAAIAAKVQASVDKATSAFEAAFAALREVREAEIDQWSLKNAKMIDTSKLERVFENGGWSSSSLWC